MHRAGCTDQDAVLGQQAHGLFVQAAVGALAVFQVFLALDEGGRVGHDHVETLFGGLELFQRFEHVAFDAGQLLGNAVEPGVTLDAVQGKARGIDAEHFAGAKGTGLYAPATDVAEQVEHALAFDVRRQTRAVHAVVVEPAGLLAFHDRRFELHAVLFQGHPLRYQAEHGFDVTAQAFGIARGRVVLEQDAGRLEHLDQGGYDVILVLLHGRRSELDHQDVAETVDHQAWQQVGIAVHQAVERLVEQALTQRQGNVDAVHQQRLVQRKLGITRQQAGADQVVRAHGNDAQGLATGGFQNRLVTGLEAMQRGRGDVDFVAVNPQVAGAQAAVGIGFETKAGQGHDVAPGKKSGIIARCLPCRWGIATNCNRAMAFSFTPGQYDRVRIAAQPRVCTYVPGTLRRTDPERPARHQRAAAAADHG
ncbi:hypothetical protein D9M71_361930 [compost metagenome]